MFSPTSIHGFSTLLSLIVPVLYMNRNSEGKSLLFWLLMGAAFSGCVSWTGILFTQSGALSLSIAIWLSITVTLGCFLLLSVITQTAWRLGLLLLPYCTLLAVIAFLWQAFPAHSSNLQTLNTQEELWTLIHIGFSIMTYAFATLAAIAGLGAFIVEKALKAKKPTALSRKLPSVIDNESLLFKLLFGAAVVLFAGILSGMGASFQEHGQMLVFNHKTVLTLNAFVVIALLLWSHYRYGTRGKAATRLVLIIYLMLSLGFLGVKFVTDVLMA